MKRQSPALGHIPKAWYSVTKDGRFWCHRCRQVVTKAQRASHTAVCWPEAGKPMTNSPKTAER